MNTENNRIYSFLSFGKKIGFAHYRCNFRIFRCEDTELTDDMLIALHKFFDIQLKNWKMIDFIKKIAECLQQESTRSICDKELSSVIFLKTISTKAWRQFLNLKNCSRKCDLKRSTNAKQTVDTQKTKSDGLVSPPRLIMSINVEKSRTSSGKAGCGRHSWCLNKWKQLSHFILLQIEWAMYPAR